MVKLDVAALVEAHPHWFSAYLLVTMNGIPINGLKQSNFEITDLTNMIKLSDPINEFTMNFTEGSFPGSYTYTFSWPNPLSKGQYIGITVKVGGWINGHGQTIASGTLLA